jgi:hypothetical protein
MLGMGDPYVYAARVHLGEVVVGRGVRYAWLFHLGLPGWREVLVLRTDDWQWEERRWDE